eukprot:1524885-Rhodomonas_salina.2
MSVPSTCSTAGLCCYVSTELIYCYGSTKVGTKCTEKCIFALDFQRSHLKAVDLSLLTEPPLPAIDSVGGLVYNGGPMLVRRRLNRRKVLARHVRLPGSRISSASTAQLACTRVVEYPAAVVARAQESSSKGRASVLGIP